MNISCSHSLRAQNSCCSCNSSMECSERRAANNVKVMPLLSCCSFGEVGVFYFPALSLCSRTNLPPSSGQISVPTHFKFAAGIKDTQERDSFPQDPMSSPHPDPSDQKEKVTEPVADRGLKSHQEEHNTKLKVKLSVGICNQGQSFYRILN